jgi:hypothetical protein
MKDITLELFRKSIFAGDRGRMKQNDLDQIQMNDVQCMNNFTLAEKLDKALVMAESPADLHGFAGGAMVHGEMFIPVVANPSHPRSPRRGKCQRHE